MLSSSQSPDVKKLSTSILRFLLWVALSWWQPLREIARFGYTQSFCWGGGQRNWARRRGRPCLLAPFINDRDKEWEQASARDGLGPTADSVRGCGVRRPKQKENSRTDSHKFDDKTIDRHTHILGKSVYLPVDIVKAFLIWGVLIGSQSVLCVKNS